MAAGRARRRRALPDLSPDQLTPDHVSWQTAEDGPICTLSVSKLLGYSDWRFLQTCTFQPGDFPCARKAVSHAPCVSARCRSRASTKPNPLSVRHFANSLRLFRNVT